MEGINEKFSYIKGECEKRENILINTINQFQEKIDSGTTRCNDISKLVKIVEENCDNLGKKLRLDVKAETNITKAEIHALYPRMAEIRAEISSSQQYKEFVNLRLSSFETSLNSQHHLLMENTGRLTKLEGST
jgi:chromosome segregation ATPase